jgi:hypothetical protein
MTADELKKDLKGIGLRLTEVPSRHLPGGLGEIHKTSIKIATVAAGTRTDHLPNTIPEFYTLTSVFNATLFTISP